MLRGFSLIELMIVVVIITLSAFFILPNYHDFFTHTDEQLLGSQLLHAIKIGRNEALTRGIAVTFCHSNNHHTCQGQWQNGQILFLDTDQNGIPTDKGDILSVYARHFPGVLHWKSALGYSYLRFYPTGIVEENGTFFYCPQGAKFAAWTISVNKSGRARLSNENNQETC